MNTATPIRLSIVTVCFNDLNNVRRTMESIEMQIARERWEHVLMDGASEDGTVEWYDSNDFDFPHTSFSAPDKGLFDAMNKSVNAVKGEYILFLNAGDLFADNEVLSRLLQRIQENIAWGYSRASVVDENGMKVRRDRGKVPYSRVSHLLRIGQICHQTVIMNVEFLKTLGGFDLSMGIGGDYHLLLRAAAHEVPKTWTDVDVLYLDGGVSARKIIDLLRLAHLSRVDALSMNQFIARLDSIWTGFQVVNIWMRKKVKPFIMPIVKLIRKKVLLRS